MPRRHLLHPTDIYVAARIRNRRRELGLSQQQVAKILGISFQQLQKYERGSNRISAGRLHDLAMLLNVTVQHFFDGMAGDEPSLINSNKLPGLALARACASLSSVDVQQAIHRLIGTLANEGAYQVQHRAACPGPIPRDRAPRRIVG